MYVLYFWVPLDASFPGSLGKHAGPRESTLLSLNQHLSSLAIIKAKKVLFNTLCREAGTPLELFNVLQ